MPSKPKNKFAEALKPKGDVAQPLTADSKPGTSVKEKPSPTTKRPSRLNTKHIGGYFDPAVSKQLRSIGLDEDTSVQALVAEALDMLFQSRRKPPIAQKSNG